MLNRVIILLLVLNCKVSSSQFLSMYSELLRSDSLVAYLRNFEDKLYLDYKSYNIDSFNTEGDSLVTFLLGDQEPASLIVSRINYFRDRRPFIFSIFSLDYKTRDTLLRLNSNVVSENDTLIEYKVTNFDSLTAYEQYYYNKRNRDYNSYIFLYPNRDTITYRTISFKNNVADVLFQYDTIIGVSPKVWYNSYTEKYYYNNSVLDSVVRTQYHPDGSEWVIFPEKYCRDQNNRLYYVKLYLIPDPISGEQEFDGYINVYGAKVPNLVRDKRIVIPSDIYSVGDKIKWDNNIILNNNSKVNLYSHDGRQRHSLQIDVDNQACTWPSSLPIGIYLIQLRNEGKTYGKVIMKNY